jgi:hypothetical protein
VTSGVVLPLEGDEGSKEPVVDDWEEDVDGSH